MQSTCEVFNSQRWKSAFLLSLACSVMLNRICSIVNSLKYYYFYYYYCLDVCSISFLLNSVAFQILSALTLFYRYDYQLWVVYGWCSAAKFITAKLLCLWACSLESAFLQSPGMYCKRLCFGSTGEYFNLHSGSLINVR